MMTASYYDRMEEYSSSKSSWQNCDYSASYDDEVYDDTEHETAECAVYQPMQRNETSLQEQVKERKHDDDESTSQYQELSSWVSKTHQDLAAFVDEIEKVLNTEVRHISDGELLDENEQEEEDQIDTSDKIEQNGADKVHQSNSQTETLLETPEVQLQQPFNVEYEEGITRDFEAMEMGTYKRQEFQEMIQTSLMKEVEYYDKLQMYDMMEFVLFLGPALSIWGLGLILSQWICPVHAATDFFMG